MVKTHDILFAACIAAAVLAPSVGAAADGPATRAAAQGIGGPGQPTAELVKKLGHGINLSMWFAQQGPDPVKWRQNLVRDDIHRIREAGFAAARFLLDPGVIREPNAAGPGSAGRFRADRLAMMDKALDMISAEGLAIIVCPYTSNEHRSKRVGTPQGAREYGEFLSALAAHLARRDANGLVIELLNEPALADPNDWDRLHAQLVRQVRRVMPAHTIIVPGNGRIGDIWDVIWAFEQLKPCEDRNVLYSFHYYEPGTFTQQGADWPGADAFFRHIHDLPWPADANTARLVLEKVKDPEARENIEKYLSRQWGPQRVAGHIGQFAKWGRQHGRPVICTEFGAYSYHARPQDVRGYLRDVRTALDHEGVPWFVWDYSDGWGMLHRTPAGLAFIPESLDALGLPAR